MRPLNILRELRRRPPHDWHRADAVFRAAGENPIAVSNVNQHIALAVEEAHDLKRLEYEAAVFIKNALAVFEFADDPDRTDLATGDADVTPILR